jgi:hypothetical protein
MFIAFKQGYEFKLLGVHQFRLLTRSKILHVASISPIRKTVPLAQRLHSLRLMELQFSCSMSEGESGCTLYERGNKANMANAPAMTQAAIGVMLK